jgi:hypothetical protein
MVCRESLLREYFPKGKDITDIPSDYIHAEERS